MDSGFTRHQGRWFADGVAFTDIARQYGTPCHVYSASAFHSALHRLQSAFCHSSPQLFYAVKTNDQLALLKLLSDQGVGFDIVSGGELKKVLAAGGDPARIVFSGAGKRADEIDAALAQGIRCLNIESAPELSRINDRAQATGRTAAVSLRLTLNIDGETHRYLTTGTQETKFGIPPAEALSLAKQAAQSPHLDFLGYSCHVGSQIRDEATYQKLAEAMAAAVAATEAEGLAIRQINMGGGFAINDQSIAPTTLSLANYDQSLARHFQGKTLIIEPGRSIAAEAGALLTRVEYVKTLPDKTIWIVDAGMNDLIRPALYDARHPVSEAAPSAAPSAKGDIVGPVCENADIFLDNQTLAAAADDYLIFFNTGAYGEVMASNYNARPFPPAVLTENSAARLIRRPQTLNELLARDLP